MTLPDVIAEINFAAAGVVSTGFRLGDPVYGMLGTSTLASSDTWADVTDRLVEVGFRRGANDGGGPILRYEAGTGAAKLRNEDRALDPANLAGPYVSAGVTQVEPMRLLRLRASWAGVIYDICLAFIDWQYAYEGPAVSTAGLTLSDGFQLLSNPRPASGATGGGELSGARIGRILNSAGWDGGRSVGVGKTTLQSTTLEGDALAELQQVADTELGELYIDGAGTVVFRDRHALFTEDRSAVSQATFGSDVAGGELPYVSVGLEYLRPSATTVRAQRVGGAVQTATAASRYPQAFEKTDLLMETDAVAQSWANWMLGVSKDPEFRFSSLTVDPRAAPDDLYPQVLGRRIGDRITIIRRPPGGGSPIQRDAFIRGIEHSYGQGRWLTSWTLQSATKYQGLVLGHPVLGKLGSNRLTY